MEVLNIYASGEGYIAYLLLKDLIKDYNLPLCVKFYDRFLPDRRLDIAIIPELSEVEIEVLKTFKERPFIISKNCKGVENCLQVGGNFLLETLKSLSENYLKPLKGIVENYQPSEFKGELIANLRNKLRFYIPLAIAKRKTILEAWRYFLGMKGFPFSGYLYPFEEENFLNILSNISFNEKVFPLLLGKTSKNFLEGIKQKGFVPFEVILNSKNNLDSELNYILLAEVVSKGLEKI